MRDDFVHSDMANDEADNKDEVYSEHYGSDGGDSNSLYYMSPSQALKVGLDVKARYKGRHTWFPGTIIGKNGDGTFDIRYSDGEEEMRVESDLIQVVNKNDDDSVCFAEGDEIQCNYKGKGRWLRGGISHVNKDGTYDIDFDNGDEERYVESIRIQSIRKTGTKAREVKKKPSGEHFATSVNELRTRTGKSAFASDGGDAIDADYASNVSKKALKRETGAFKIGDKIEGNYGGYGRWFKGMISYANKDGTYDVRYDDGDQETSVSPSHLRFSASISKDPPKKTTMFAGSLDVHEFEPGDEIEGNFKGRGRWYRGKIDIVNKDGTYDVRYDDGDSERGVRAYNIRGVKRPHDGKKSHGGPSVLRSTYKTGDPVKANYKSRSLWLEGKICQVNRNGTYGVQFSNGNIEKGVIDHNLRSFSAPQIGSPNKNRRGSENFECDDDDALTAGDTIEGKNKGKGRWYKGNVARMNIDGTHDLQYDDGDDDTEKGGVSMSHIQSVSGKPKRTQESFQKSSSNNSSSSGESGVGVKGGSFRKCGDDPMLLQVGDDIEARFQGRGTWYEGTIVKKHKDGTFHVSCAGDEEYFVEQHLIRRKLDVIVDEPALEHSSSGPPRCQISSSGGAWESNANCATLFCVGEEVQGNYKGKGKWYKCKIEKANKDGTYRIKYVDGDVEDHVKVSCLSSSTETTKVGGSKLYMNKFGCCSDIASLQVGDDVEGNYKGKGRWIRGLVTYVNMDHQSYDICYKTGIEEYGVAPSNIRPLGHVCNKTHDKKSARRDDEESDLDCGTLLFANSEGSSYKSKTTWINGDKNLNLKNRSDTRDHSYIDRDNESNSHSSHQPKIIRSAAHHHISTSKMSHAMKSSNNLKAENLKLFDVIEANYKGTGRWLRGKICYIHGDGLSYDVLYDNNKCRENYVKAHNIHFLSHQPEEGVESESEPKALRRIGDEIEVNYKGKNKWQRGIIRNVHGDGSYRIQYAAGGSEDVFPSNIRSIINKRPNSQRKRISDSESEEVQPYHPSQHARQRSLYPKLTGSAGDTDSEEFHSLEGAEKKQRREFNIISKNKKKSGSDTVKGNSSVRLVSERLWFVLNSVVHGGVDVKRAPRGILRQVFESVDKDNDGLITSLQLYKLLKRLDAPILDGGHVDDLFQVMDFNRDGLVSLRDIVELALWDAKGNVPSNVLPVYKRLAEEATTNIKPLSGGKKILGRRGGRSSVDRVKCVEDALAGERATRWSELPRRLATVGVTLRSRDVDALEGVLDTEETGRVPSEVFAVWLCSGLDIAMLKLKTGHLLRELEERGVDPEMVLKQAHKRSGGKGRGRTISEATFIEGLRMLGMPLTHSQLCGLISLLSVDEDENENDDDSNEGFGYSQTSKQMKKQEVDVIQFLALSGEQQQLLHCNDKSHSRRWKGGSKSLSPTMGSSSPTGSAHRKRGTVGEKHGKKKLNPDCSNVNDDVVSGGEGTSSETFSSEDDGGRNNHKVALFDKKTLKALWSLALEDANEDSTLRATFKNSNNTTTTATGELVVGIPIKRCEKVLRKRLGSKVSKKRLRTVMEFLDKLQEMKTHGTVRRGSCRTGSRQVLIPVLDIMELSLSQESSNMLADLHNRMAKDLALKVSQKQKKMHNENDEGGKQELGILVNIISIATKPFKSFDKTAETTGFVTSKAFKKGLTKLGCGTLKDYEKTYLVQHFDVSKEGVVNYEQFGIWLASGLDSKRLENKMECLQRMLKTKGISLHTTP